MTKENLMQVTPDPGSTATWSMSSVAQVNERRKEGVTTGGGAAVEPYIDKWEVAKRIGKTVRTVDNWMKRGILPYYKIGRSVEFKWSDVAAHLEQTCRVCRRG